MGFEVNGKLIQILSEVSGEGKNGTWRKQEIVIETEEAYPKKICISAWGDRVNALKSLSLGDSIKVSFDLESREYNGKWYTDARAWKIETETGNTQSTQNKTAVDPFPEDLMNPSNAEKDDLPF